MNELARESVHSAQHDNAAIRPDLVVTLGLGLLAGAFEGDLILGYLAALLDGRSLGDAFGLDFVRLLHRLSWINRLRAVDWRDHRGPYED